MLSSIDWAEIDRQQEADDPQPVPLRGPEWRPPTLGRVKAVPPQQ
ncbi:hypothetical protein [Roseobacter weihaiensis]|nr:hypothetical protein [Roseobacter sp. H9]